MAALPVDIEQLFIDIYYYFKHSSKRNQQFVDMWHSFYNNEPKVLLKHRQTRWSLLRCIRRYLDLFDGLLLYFCSCDDQTAKVVSITERLENPLTKPILHFLNHILPFMDRFNRSFQSPMRTRVNCIRILSGLQKLMRSISSLKKLLIKLEIKFIWLTWTR